MGLPVLLTDWSKKNLLVKHIDHKITIRDANKHIVKHKAVASYLGLETLCGFLWDNISFLVPCARLSPD